MSEAVLPDRPDLYVVVRMLERLWRVGEPMLKTKLQVAANVNYNIFTKYLIWLISRNLVVPVYGQDDHERVSITEKGRKAYRQLVEWMDEFSRGQRGNI